MALLSTNKQKIVILLSGRGSTAKAIIDNCKSGYINGEVVAVISDNEKAYGLTIAREQKIATHAIAYGMGTPKSISEAALSDAIIAYQADWIILAGFMRILSSNFVTNFKGKIINIHPSLLPKYPGLNTHEKVIEEKDKEHGTSIHFVDETLDLGPLIAQGRFKVTVNDSSKTLEEKVKAIEHKLYPYIIKNLCEGKIDFTGINTPITLDYN